ncbi:MAG TPA: hypothetical protein DEA08_23385, partial [Planctomycetes bacterium]|nr:hypothetical protein [Planctomycetota bacterium]
PLGAELAHEVTLGEVAQQARHDRAGDLALEQDLRQGRVVALFTLRRLSEHALAAGEGQQR